MIGHSLGSYKITDMIGEGGMAVVYQAEHVLIGRRVAIKRLLPDMVRDDALVERFFNEARAAARLQHPGLVEVFDFGHDVDGSAYIVMELLEGESLASRIARESPLAAATALSITRQVAAAVHAAHEHGIVHRDLKPENLYLVAEHDAPDGVRVKVLDFGIAKLAASEDQRSVKTKTGALFGTPRYMAPEQCRNATAVDRRADIYSLGCILYEMLVGAPPFKHDTWAELVAAHMYEPPQPPSQRDGRIPSDVEAIVLRALAKRPDDRFPTMLDFANELEISWRANASGSMPALFSPPAGYSAVMAQKTARTLGEAATQMEPSARTHEIAPRRHTVWRAIGVAAALGAAVVLYLATGREPPRRVVSEPAMPVKPPVVTGAAIAPIPPADATASGSDDEPDKRVPDENQAAPAAQVQLMVTSLPPGAEVYRAIDGVRIGRTPFHRGFERSDGELELIVKLVGYRDARVVMSTATDGTETVKLVQLRATTRVPKPPGGRDHDRGAPPSNPPGGSATTVLDPYKDQ
jgi:tRNA A-37 threonylcarbamoyl transferase component Bud32